MKPLPAFEAADICTPVGRVLSWSLLFGALFALPVKVLWNFLMPAFSAWEIGFGPAYAIALLATLLFQR